MVNKHRLRAKRSYAPDSRTARPVADVLLGSTVNHDERPRVRMEVSLSVLTEDGYAC